MNYIFATKDEYHEFMFTLKQGGKVYRFWREILKRMPENIHLEIKRKPTNLAVKSKGNFALVNAKPYQFECRNASKSLQDYLDQFAVFVEDDSEEVFMWREQIQSIVA